MGNKKQNRKPATKANAEAAAKKKIKASAHQKAEANTKTKTEKEGRSGTEKFLIIFAIVALVGILASIVVGIVSCTSQRRIDFLEDDLSKYIYIAESDYKNFEAEVKVDPVQDYDISNAILKVLAANKSKDALNDGAFLKNQTVTPGDVVYMYYRGYIPGENGEKEYFDGGCNFSGEESELEIGGGKFISGFELNLVGKNPKDYGTFKKYEKSGIIKNTDKVFVTYTRVTDNGQSSVKEYVTVNLEKGKELVDASRGIGFYNKIVGSQYGQTLNEFTVETDNGTEKIRDAVVYRSTGANNLIQVTYSAMYFDGTYANGKTEIIDLSDPKLDEKYGTGFKRFFEVGAPVGTKAVKSDGTAETLNTTITDGQNSFFDITVQSIYEIKGTPLTIEAYFPVDYTSEDLQGKTAMFEVFITKSQVYDAPELNDAFITDTLKLTAEDLASFGNDGDSLVEKYRAKVKADLEDKYKESFNNALDAIIWKHYLDKVVVKRLPKQDVRYFYDSYYNDLMAQYSYYSQSVTLDAFARQYLGIASNADWKAKLQEMAEQSLAQKLAFYYVIRRENLIIPDAEYEARYGTEVENQLEMYLESVECTRDKYDSDEAYENAKAEYKEEMLKVYTEDYFREMILFDYAFETLRTYVIPKA